MKTFEAVLQSLISLTEERLGSASDRDGQWLDSAVQSAAAEIRQLGTDAEPSTVVQQKAKRGRRATRTQEEPVRTSRRRQPAAPDDNPSTTVQEEPTEAAAEPPTQRVTRARARRPKSDAPATHVVTRKTRARAKRGAKAEGERPSIAVAASELGDAGTTVGVLEQIVEEHESPAAPSSAPPTPPPMASPEREAAALDAPAGQQTASTPPHCEEPCVEQPAPAARTTPQAAPLPAAPHRTPLSVPAAAQGRMAASLSHGALLASCSRVRRAVVAFREAQQEPAAPEEPPTAAEAPQISSVPCVEAQQPSAPPPPPSMASNVVATIRSFLPAAKPMAPPGPAAGKKPIKVKALAAAEAARQREAEREAQRARQREELERQRKERHKAKQAEEERRQAEERLRKEQARKQRDEDTTRDDRPRPGTVLEAKRRLEETRKQGMDVKRTKLGAAPARVPLQPTVVPQATVVQPQDTVQSTPSTVPSTVPTSLDTCSGAQEEGPLQSYIISPQRDDSESEGEDAQRAQKPIPDWARGRNVVMQLRSQAKADPDEIFHPAARTVNLQEIFGAEKPPTKDGKPPKYSYSKRGSSCNWIEDRVTWKEELTYKKAMGYL